MSKKCFLFDIVHKYLSEILQMVNDDVGYYDMSEQTKCLNTAVLVAVLYLGDRALNTTQSCDVSTVLQRHSDIVSRTKEHNPHSTFDPTIFFIQELQHDLFCKLKRNDARYIYYIMITDSMVSSEHDINDKIQFPGHVFVVERIGSTYILYQSYIHHYDLNGHFIANNNTFEVRSHVLKQVFTELERLFTEGIWTPETTRIWKALTHVNSPDFEGRVFKSHVHVCYRKILISQCYNTLSSLVTKALEKRKTSNTFDSRLQELHAEINNVSNIKQ